VDAAGDFTLVIGSFDQSWQTFAGQRLVYLDFEEPNRFWTTWKERDRFDVQFDKVFTLCPHTAHWLNRRERSDRRTPMFFPFNIEHLPRSAPKEFDAIYTGSLHSPGIAHLVQAIAAFNYRLVSQVKHPLTTDFNVTYAEKLALIARSRVTLVQNLLYTVPSERDCLRKIEDFSDNQAFNLVNWRRTLIADASWRTMKHIGMGRRAFRFVEVPQVKSRAFEAAFCRSLILCRRDPWNEIERYFDPEVEFVYFEPDKLTQTLAHILRNYADYQDMIERAYERAMQNYTTEAFVSRYLRPYGEEHDAIHRHHDDQPAH
jgi:hypothetical protein